MHSSILIYNFISRSVLHVQVHNYVWVSKKKFILEFNLPWSFCVPSTCVRERARRWQNMEFTLEQSFFCFD